LSFTLGILYIALTSYAGGAFPGRAPALFILKCVLLLSARWITYWDKNFHYFLFDFCYFANALCIVLLAMSEASAWHSTLFRVCFAFAVGPLSAAVPTWRNSLVFHSADKMTSLFIHLGPIMLMYALRFEPEHAHLPCNVHSALPCPYSPTDGLVWPLIMYGVWQTLYYVRVDLLAADRLANRVTSYSFMVATTTNKRSLVYRLSTLAGDAWAPLGFRLVQAAYTLLT
jgi:hypothetical protein